MKKSSRARSKSTAVRGKSSARKPGSGKPSARKAASGKTSARKASKKTGSRAASGSATRKTAAAKKKKKTKTKKAPARAAKAPRAKAPAAAAGKARRKAAPKAASAGGRKASAPKAAPTARTARRTSKPRRRRLGRRELAKYEKLLLERQRELTQAYITSKGDSRSNLDDGTEDYIDYAVSSYAREFLLSLTELDRKQLLLVDEALRRLKRRDFGRCQQCAVEIAPKRLEVAPWARHCVRCQELEEQGLLVDDPVKTDEDDDELDVRHDGEDDEDYEPEVAAGPAARASGDEDAHDDAEADDA